VSPLSVFHLSYATYISTKSIIVNHFCSIKLIMSFSSVTQTLSNTCVLTYSRPLMNSNNCSFKTDKPLEVYHQFSYFSSKAGAASGHHLRRGCSLLSSLLDFSLDHSHTIFSLFTDGHVVELGLKHGQPPLVLRPTTSSTPFSSYLNIRVHNIQSRSLFGWVPKSPQANLRRATTI
jgi:hypothetical protein